MTPAQFVDAVQKLDFENTFNPYAERCSVYDHDDAPRRRSNALLAILHAAVEEEVDSLWLGRDLGYRGGRRTGLALTDDANLVTHAARWEVVIERPTKGDEIVERTATVIWAVLSRIESPVFLWNVFPLHPHIERRPFTNRGHNAQERRAGEDLLSELIALLCPRRLVPIGNDAAATAMRLYAPEQVVKVRHPSYGGQKTFLRQVGELYGVQADVRLISSSRVGPGS